MPFVKIDLSHNQEGEKHDFNLRNVPMEIILPLINALRLEYSNRQSIAAAPSFRQERAIQHQRHLDDCARNGNTPQQQFIDFPLY